MGFLKKLFGGSSTPDPGTPASSEPITKPRRSRAPDILALRGRGWYGSEIAGGSDHQENRRLILRSREPRGAGLQVTANLILEDCNSCDENAVRVAVDGLEVGHLNSGIAARYREMVARGGHPGAIGDVQAVVREDGVWLDLPADMDA